MTKANECTCPSGDGSLRHPCPAHPASVELAGVGAKLTFINGRPAMCGCQVEYSSGGGEYSDVIDVTLCAKHSGSAILDLVATNRIALTPEYEGQWHADLYLDREIPLAKAEGATPAEAVLALMSAERIDPEQGGVDQAGGDRWDALQSIMEWTAAENIPDDRKLCLIRNAARAALAQPSPAQAEKAEVERPEVVGQLVTWPTGQRYVGRVRERKGCKTEDVMTVAQHERIVAFRWERAMDLMGEHVARISEKLTAERDAALARVAELEKQEPVAHLRASDLERLNQPGIVGSAGSLWNGPREGFVPLYAAPVAQAQHSVPETINEEANSFLRIADAGQFKDNAVAVRTAAVIIRGLLHRPPLMQSIIRHRICLTPEYEGQWHADLYGEDGEVQHHAEADTPDEAVRAVVALAAAPGKEGV
ncbi:TPA: hypothetical protein L4V43_004134 [Pseudomonas aeruginosa]|nr:hypothetical protein [Pseudomonas aeruginosa]